MSLAVIMPAVVVRSTSVTYNDVCDSQLPGKVASHVLLQTGASTQARNIQPDVGGSTAPLDQPGTKLVKQNEQDLKDLPDDCCTYDTRPASSYKGRWASIEKALKESKAGSDGGTLSVIDVGSNFGYFSLQTAMHFPKAFVFGIEGSVGQGNGNMGMQHEDVSQSPGVQNHLKWIRKLGLNNSAIATEVWDYDRVLDLQGRGFIADAIFLLSVFHHMDNIASSQYGSYGFSEKIEGTVSLMSNMLDLATMHFIELPNLGNGNETADPHRMTHM
jgi:hypothetical protein